MDELHRQILDILPATPTPLGKLVVVIDNRCSFQEAQIVYQVLLDLAQAGKAQFAEDGWIKVANV